MNPLASSAAALAKSLRADTAGTAAEARGGAAAPGAGFAGLLGQQQQRLAADAGHSSAYDGSAFDVKPAQAQPSRPRSVTAQSEANRTLQAQQAARSELARQRARAPQEDPTPTAAPAPQPVRGRVAEAPREPQAPARPETESREAGGTSAAEAPAPAATPSGSPADGPAADRAATDMQALLDLMGRLSTPEAALSQSGPRGLPGDAATQPGAADGIAALPAAAAGEAARAALEAEAAGATLATEPGEASAFGAAGEAGAPAVPATASLATPTNALAAGASLAPASAPAQATVPLQVAVPVTSPDFSQALASQLTTLARGGVQEAQLQLNPADMGPITVQIVLDGSQAQIDFAAAHARTREALEAAWPALAASLHGAGLTLGGGGVFEQRPDARDGEAGRPPGGGPDVADDTTGTGLAQRPVQVDTRRGLLDLYA